MPRKRVRRYKDDHGDLEVVMHKSGRYLTGPAVGGFFANDRQARNVLLGLTRLLKDPLIDPRSDLHCFLQGVHHQIKSQLPDFKE
jgi:hypothetical protein